MNEGIKIILHNTLINKQLEPNQDILPQKKILLITKRKILY
jgi:hypothetical protein